MILEVIDELIEFVDVDDEISDRTKEHWAKMVNKHRGQGWWRWGEHCVGSSWWVGHRSPLNQAFPSWFWNLDQTVRSNRKNLKPLIFAVLLASRIALWEKIKDPCELLSDLMVLRTVNGSYSSQMTLFKKRKFKVLNGTIPEYLLFLVGKNISTSKEFE